MKNVKRKAILKPGPRSDQATAGGMKIKWWGKMKEQRMEKEPWRNWTGMTLGQVGVSLFEYVRANPHSIGDVAETFYLRTISEAAGGSQSDILPLPLPIVPE